eukprot:1161859-Pelagomonas_calceolata.AAC.16
MLAGLAQFAVAESTRGVSFLVDMVACSAQSSLSLGACFVQSEVNVVVCRVQFIVCPQRPLP